MLSAISEWTFGLFLIGSRARRTPTKISRLKSPMKPFPHAKLQGEWAEACFAAEALRRGFIVSKPLGDSAPYDFVLEFRRSFGLDCHSGRRGPRPSRLWTCWGYVARNLLSNLLFLETRNLKLET